MRLSTIKLAGFKSFVDPTSFHAPTNLTGIVGPNGCGKSNIIDAVRWVMGEGSAKVLRGESMADVIFAGSSSRKPVGTATVELIFDNSDGRIGGQFAAYNEISVKRQVSRDGVSLYFINGTRCRRKDVRDLFLGTGLGSSSYSIIEQGMISEIVDARAQDIRSHLEEAAGISRYKERRRETENRIGHTRENLARLSDLREEVSKHLWRLKRQAGAAERYKKFKQQKRELENLQLAVKWRELDQRARDGAADLGKRETLLQESVASQRKAEKSLEDMRQAQAEASEALNAIQGELYETGGEIARLEQSIEHEKDLQNRQDSDYAETREQLDDIEKHMVLDKAQVEELTSVVASLEPELSKAQAAELEAEKAVADAEKDLNDWQQRFEAHHEKSARSQREADQGRVLIESLDQRLLDAGRRLEGLEKESGSFDTRELSQAIHSAKGETKEKRKALEREQAQLQSMKSEHTSIAEEQQALEGALQDARAALGECRGRLDSLKAMKEATRSAGDRDDQIESLGLGSADLLSDVIAVDPGWEMAVETVLGHWLASLLVDSVADLETGKLERLEGIDLTVMQSGGETVKPDSDSLATKVQGPAGIMAILESVRICDALEDGVRRRESLAARESFITKQGHWVGREWIRVAGDASSGSGLLIRDKEIEALQSRAEQLAAEAETARSQIADVHNRRQDLEDRLVGQQQRVNELHQEVAALEANLHSRQQNLKMLTERMDEITAETERLKSRIEADQDAVQKARTEQEARLDTMAELQAGREELEAQRQTLMTARNQARNQLKQASADRHDLALRLHSKQASLDSLRQSLERMDNRAGQLQQRFLSLSEQRAKRESPEKRHEQEMARLLEQQVEVQGRLGAARAKLQGLEDDYRKLDAARQSVLQEVEERRADAERIRLSQQEIEFKARSLVEQLEEAGEDVKAVAAGLPKDATSEDWAAEIEKLQQKIQALEPVNLAAIQEYEEELKRKEYLDSQNEDLCDALTTLENAIAKIDRKTRTRFKETFEQVNKGLQDLFPRLFGGGHAYLELTGEDLLTTGVSIMARPPGKRVSSIHLLSGGEKALTAVAFVFAIFQLNPAPFCLLDEVDAPLDEANVARFGSMVGEMSENVQFVIVTHNKITMEMIHQLSGVTMREPGVSRLVQVDIEEAARLAAS